MEQKSNFKFRFIHASDTHLGSILHINSNDEYDMDVRFSEAVYTAFRRVCDAAINLQVDFIIISGDIYDRELKTVKASRFFYDQCKRLEEKNINIYLIRGNHDPLGEDKELFVLPQNVHTFSCEDVEALDIYIDRDLVGKIIGQSYKNKWEGRKIFKDYGQANSLLYNIGVLHTGLDINDNRYVPSTIEELKSIKNINYWALGHIHKCKVINSESPAIAYSGIPQGRDIGEYGIGGCLLVEVKEDLTENIKYIPISSFVWLKITLNIDEKREGKLDNLNDLEEFIIEEGKKILSRDLTVPEGLESIYPADKVLEGYIVQWNLEGRGKMDSILREDEENVVSYLKDRLNDYFMSQAVWIYTDSIYINTLKEVSLDYLSNRNQVVKSVNEIVDLLLRDENMRKEVISSFGNLFEKVNDREDFNEEKIPLDDQLIEDIINASREIIIEKFIEKGEYN